MLINNIASKPHFCGYLKFTLVNNFFGFKKCKPSLYFTVIPSFRHHSKNRKLGTKGPAFVTIFETRIIFRRG